MTRGDKQFSIERFFRALADRTRLRILNLLGADEVCVCFLSEILRTNQPSISRHLAYLKRAGIVGARREGKWMHYRIVTPPDPYAASFLSDVRAWLAQDKAMQRDRKQLVRVCCAPELPIPLQGAPKPASVVSA
jgi:ArsR family transcriptional regulator, arsenate/arsenite/antimonite-responsive transcriptional repressor